MDVLDELLKGKNIEFFSMEDKQRLLDGKFDDLSEDAKRYILDEFETSDVIATQVERTATSTMRGLGIAAVDPETDEEQERRSRMMFDTDPVKSFGASIGGAIIDPVPGGALTKMKAGAGILKNLLAGARGGAAYGAIEPVYEEYGDSRVMNTLVGGSVGGVIGGAVGVVGKLFNKAPISAAKQAEAESAAADAAIRAENDSQIALDSAAQTINANDMQQGIVSQTVRNNNTNPAELKFDPQTGTINHVKVDSTPVDFDTLPPGLANLRQAFGGSTIQWASKIDAALHKIASNRKSKEAAALRGWLKSKNPRLTDEDIDKLAVDAYNSHRDILPNSPVKGRVLYAEQSPVAEALFKAAQEPRVSSEPYIPQGKVKLDDAFSPEDLQVIEQTLGMKPFMYSWRDLKTGKTISKQEALWRMEQLGIEPVSVEQLKAQRAARDAEFEPSVQAEPEFVGAPKTMGSVGARGVRPATRYAEDLGGPMYRKFMKGEISEAELATRILDGQGDIRDREYLRNRTSGKPRYMGIRGMNQIAKEISKGEYNDIVDMIIQREQKGQDPLPPEIVTALRQQGYDTYVEKQVRNVLKDVANMKKNGESFNSKKGMGLLEEYFYYSGLHLAFENQKTYASRSLYAWKKQGLKIKKNHPMASVFPGVKC